MSNNIWTVLESDSSFIKSKPSQPKVKIEPKYLRSVTNPTNHKKPQNPPSKLKLVRDTNCVDRIESDFDGQTYVILPEPPAKTYCRSKDVVMSDTFEDDSDGEW